MVPRLERSGNPNVGWRTGGRYGSQQTHGRQRTQGRSQEARAIEEPADQNLHVAQQEGRTVHGRQEEREEVQGRSEGEVMGRFFIGIIVLSVAIVLGMYLHILAL